MDFSTHLQETTGSQHTRRAYLRDAAEFENFLDGRPPSVRLLQEYIRGLNHGERKPQSIGRKLSGIRRWLAWRRVELGDEAASEVLSILRDFRVSPPTRQIDRAEVRSLEADEFTRLEEALHGQSRALAQFLWWSGARISEALGDSLAGIPPLSVEDGLHLVQHGWVSQNGKGGKRRTLLLPSVGRQILGGYLNTRKALGIHPGANGGLWSISRSGFNLALHRASDTIGVPRVHAHIFRHAFKSRLRQAGVEAELISALLGHGPKSTTDRYGRAGIEELLRAIQKLEGEKK